MTWISQVCAPTTPGTCALPCSRERERVKLGGIEGKSEIEAQSDISEEGERIGF